MYKFTNKLITNNAISLSILMSKYLWSIINKYLCGIFVSVSRISNQNRCEYRISTF